jgi:hypothetical protein
VTTWFDRAACRGLTDLFFDSRQRPPRWRAHDAQIVAATRECVEICRACPVIDDCHAYAMTVPADDLAEALVYAGRTREELIADRLCVGAEVHTRVVRCGTERGYQVHRRRGEETCQPCREAHAAVVLERRHRDRCAS